MPGSVETKGATPEATVNAQIVTDIARKGAESVFLKTAPGVFGLRSWAERPEVSEYVKDRDDDALIRVPFFPSYEETVTFSVRSTA